MKKNIKDDNSAGKRFSYYDILVHLCQNYGLLKLLSSELLKLVVSEINVYAPLETAAAIQTIFGLCKLADFDLVISSAGEATKLLEELFKMVVAAVEKYGIGEDARQSSERPDQETYPYIEDDTFLISITKLITIFNPKLLLTIKIFDKFTKNFIYIYLESLAYVTKKAKFDEFNVNLTALVVNLISENLNSIVPEDQINGLMAIEHASVHDFEKVKVRIFELATLLDTQVRKQCLTCLNTRSVYLEGCKSIMRIHGFLDWLLIKSSEHDKVNSELKYEIVCHVSKFSRNELKLHSKIQLELKRYVKDGAFYDSNRVDAPGVATEEAI